jgi:hypothetical protein
MSFVPKQFPADLLTGTFPTGAIYTLGENTLFLLNTALSADGMYCGEGIPGTAGETLVFGDLCSPSGTGGSLGYWQKADAGIITATAGDCRGRLGICILAAAGSGQPTRMLLRGMVRAAAYSAVLTLPNAQIFVSETAGAISNSLPLSADHAPRCIGTAALNTNTLDFNPSPDYMTRFA